MTRHCEPFEIPASPTFQGGVKGIMCFTESRTKPCVVCGKAATKLCDYVIDDDGRTCDASMCVKHAFHPLLNGTPIFGENKDYCPEHAASAIKKFIPGEE